MRMMSTLVETKTILENVHVGIPYSTLAGELLPLLEERGINPEISFDADALDNLDGARLAVIAKALRVKGLRATVHAPFMDMAPGSPDPMVRAVLRHRLEQIVHVAKELRPETVVCHAGYEDRRYRHMKDQWLEYSLLLWRWLASRLHELGARLVLENVFERGPEELYDLFDVLYEEGVGFCLDAGHQTAFSSASLQRWLDVLGQFLFQLHLHDNWGDKDDHLAIGAGSVDFPLLFSWLKLNREGPPVITIEPHVREDIELSILNLAKLWPW
jgi:sugar phosphate isomerase/epimerase